MAPRDEKNLPASGEQTTMESNSISVNENETTTATGNNNHDAGAEEMVAFHEHQAEAAGYTPLTGNTLASGHHFLMTTGADSDGEGGVFFADMSAFSGAMDDGDDQNPFVSEELNFRALADEALRSLTDEYDMTLKGVNVEKELRSNNDVGKTSASSESNQQQQQEEHEGRDTSQDDFHVNLEDADFDPTRKGALLEDSRHQQQQEHQARQQQTPIMEQKKLLPPVDTNAVRKAVQAISLQTPSLQSNLAKWEEEKADLIAPREHPVIPPLPLGAFRKRSPKAKTATSNLSRSATLADALHRLGCVGRAAADYSSLSSNDRLDIHVLGADHVECSSEDSLRLYFGPLVRWLSAMDDDNAPRHICITCIGPNVPEICTKAGTNLMPPSLKKTSRLESAVATCHVGSYHSWLGENERNDGAAKPDLLVAFNAGIWGYDEWRPTLEALVHLPAPVYFVVTSYTVQEAEDDAQVIEQVVKDSDTRGDPCMWPFEPNIFGSRKARPTATAPVKDREYRENAAWQAWKLGGGRKK